MLLANRLKKTVWVRSAGSIDQFFANSEKGLWYDPYDLSTMFQDTGATTPVTTDGDPVRYLIDKSGNAVHLSSATGLTFRTDGTYNWLEMAGGTNNFLVASGSKTKMAFAHSPGGFTGCYGVQYGTVSNPDDVYVLYSNNGFTSGKIGVLGAFDDRLSVPRNNALVHLTTANTVNPPVINVVSQDFFTPNVSFVYSEVTDPDNATLLDRHRARIIGDADTKASNGNKTAVTSNATDEFHLGAVSNLTSVGQMVGRIYQFVMVEGQLVEFDRLTLESLVQDKTP